MSIINVEINTHDIESDDLIEVIESRGYRVMMPGQIDEDIESLHRTLDEIHNLYHAFCAWKDFGNKNENFERDLKSFFLETIDMKVL